MPTYEYECNNCGYKFEAFQSIKADPLTECPKCGGEVVRLISKNVGLIFKGSGFYITDYRSEDYKRKAKEEQGKSAISSDTSKSNPKDLDSSSD